MPADTHNEPVTLATVLNQSGRADLRALQSDAATVVKKLQSITPGSPAPSFDQEIAAITQIETVLRALLRAATPENLHVTGDAAKI